MLKNEDLYKQYNLKKDMHGIVLECDFNILDVLFFNPYNQGDYIVAKINIDDVKIEKEKLPEKIIKELTARIDTIKTKAKMKIKPLKIKAYDMVELMV